MINPSEFARKIFNQWILGLKSRFYSPDMNLRQSVVDCSISGACIYANTGIMLHILSKLQEMPQIQCESDDARSLQNYVKAWVPVDEALRLVIREQLLEKVWGYGYAGDTRTVDVHIRWLREKIEENPDNPVHLITLRGVGYKFEV